MTKRFRKPISLFLALLLCLLLTAAAYADSTAVIAEFEPLGDAATIETDVKLSMITLKELFPSYLAVQLEGGSSASQLIPVTWKCVENYDEIFDAYHFTPVLDGYRLAEGVTAPTLTVTALNEHVTPPLNDYPDMPGTDIPILGSSGRRFLKSSASSPTYNAWEEGRLPPVRNQNPYGTCWAFSTIGTMEADLISRGAGTDIDLSELHLAYYAFNQYVDEKNCNIGDDYYSSYGTFLNQGGNAYMATRVLANMLGGASEAAVPYSWAGDYTPGAYEGRAFKDAQLTGAYRINPMDIEGIKKAIYQHGGVSTLLHWDDSYFSYTNTSFYCPDVVGTNHVVMLVGWDDNFSRFNFRAGTPEADGAWLVRNSWGDDNYSRDGYFWMSYYDQCQANFSTVFAIDAQNWQYDHCYAYDSVPMPNYSWSYSGTATAQQRFTVDGSEEIRAVGIETDSANLGITVELSLGDTTVSASAVTTYPGYYTIVLPEPLSVPVRSDVDLTIYYSGDEIWISMEDTDAWYNGEAQYYGACGSGGLVIDDYNTGMDGRIKLFTMDSAASGDGLRISAEAFPDTAFRNYISSSFDTNHNGFLSQAELDAVTAIDFVPASASGEITDPDTQPVPEEDGGEQGMSLEDGFYPSEEDSESSLLEVSDIAAYDSPGPVTSLKGLEYFRNLQALDCKNNQLTALDISRNTALTSLDCSGNSLQALDLSSTPQLHTLLCSGNPLDSLDVSMCPNLAALVGSASPVLANKTIVFSTDAGTLSLDIGVPLTPSFSLGTGMPISSSVFPDPYFLDYVRNSCDMDQDGTLSDYEISQVTCIECQGSEAEHGQISSLQGIEYFSALEYLNCSYNALTSLNVGQNTALNELDCRNNALTGLDVHGSTSLQYLFCSSNPFTNSLNVSGCSQLLLLACSDCSLTDLSLDGCTSLAELDCYNNPLTDLNLSDCSLLQTLSCFNTALSSLDLTGFSALENLYCYSCPSLSTLNVSSCDALSRIYCYSSPLQRLELGGCVNLNFLSCFNTQLTSLDLSGFASLQSLYCQGSSLESLNLSGCTSLRNLYCFNAQLSTLILKGCNDLQTLLCFGNQFMSLDISPCRMLAYLPEIVQPTVQDGVIRYSLFNYQLSYDSGVELLALDKLTLPGALTHIEEEAFSGGRFSDVHLPESTESIGALAFADCQRLVYIYIPQATEYIDPQAFENVTYLSIAGIPGSRAEQFAAEHGYRFIATDPPVSEEVDPATFLDPSSDLSEPAVGF